MCAAVLAAVSCKKSDDNKVDVAGQWRAVLSSPGGPLPFGLEIADPGETPPAVLINGPERVAVTAVEVKGRNISIRIDGYDSRIDAEATADGRRMAGTWHKTVPGGESKLPFAALFGDRKRFSRIAEGRAPIQTVGGRWQVEFQDDGGAFPAVGELTEESDGRVLGTFLTETGDYRYLEGVYHGGRLRLSAFDGAHAFLFDAAAKDDGTLRGEFWSRDSYHATWTARRTRKSVRELLGSPFDKVHVTTADSVLRFSFPDLDGRPLSLQDSRYRGKVVIVDLFGTWCPNCGDQAPVLVKWHEQFRDRGLEIIGLAFEYSGDRKRDEEMLRRYQNRFGIEYPLALAGTSDKAEASKALPGVSSIKAFPTTIFVGRDGRVRKIHSGFAGPGTGRHHEQEVAELSATITELLAESP